MTHFKAPMLKIIVLVVATAIATQLLIVPPTNVAAQDVAQTTEVVIPDGTEISVVTTEELSSKTATEGDPVNFRIAEDVVINGKVVVAKDSLVKGTVAAAKKSGFMGRGGNLAIRIESAMTVDNQKLKLRSAKNKEGGDKTGTTVALVV